ncbi:uncharacterized protein BO66DRAFT_440058 [Aspergillus aculeatinus CBS 121060]|uniref:Uncharacterized protein n=1 Tax=Aspergillus aculeatinus CBS 121060 TaxID=1448322 RepID=A0ACD1H4L8_9EURO|nr:hypothetical protein BO66DRAFT_440058 [Aspergillus aculeatinus CBS 121060]RAH68444.1 hypothetical protein BO66DRAFT_440058 [Aspergillus aculeatinus CBS 121060]
MSEAPTENVYASLLATARSSVDTVLFLETIQQEIETGYALRTELRHENERALSSLLAAMPKLSERGPSVRRLEEQAQQLTAESASLREKMVRSRRQLPLLRARTEAWLWTYLRTPDASELATRLNGGGRQRGL